MSSTMSVEPSRSVTIGGSVIKIANYKIFNMNFLRNENWMRNQIQTGVAWGEESSLKITGKSKTVH